MKKELLPVARVLSACFLLVNFASSSEVRAAQKSNRSNLDRWQNSEMNYDFYSKVVNDENCASSLQEFAGCILSLEALVNESLFEKDQGKVVFLLKPTAKVNTAKDSEMLKVGRISLVKTEINRRSDAELSEYLKQDRELYLKEVRKENATEIQRLQDLRDLYFDSKTSLIDKLREEIFLIAKAKLNNAMFADATNQYLSVAKDPHSSIQLLKTFLERGESTSEKIVGLGAVLEYDFQSKAIYVQRLINGSGAEKAGLRVGDQLVKVDGISISTETAGNPFAGKEGTKFKLTLLRDGVEIEREITRIEASLPLTDSRVINFKGRNFGYASLSKFSNQTQCDDMYSAFIEFQSFASGAILDLRGNPGGRIDVATCIASIFLGPNLPVAFLSQDQAVQVPISAQEILKPKVRETSEISTLTTLNRKVFSKPLIVLVDQHSVSASELLADALRDYNAAILVGMPTFGKGTTMSMRAASRNFDEKKFDGTSKSIDDNVFILMGTDGIFYSPKGTTHHGTGTRPHITVPKGLELNPSERFAISEEDLFLFPLKAKPLPVALDPDFVKGMNKLIPRFGCILDANLANDYNARKHGDYTRDMQILTGLQEMLCQLRK